MSRAEYLTYDVHIYKTRVRKGARRSGYGVRWAVAGMERHETFPTSKLAEAFRSQLTGAASQGVAFDTRTGLPETLARAKTRRTWYEHATEFVDMKWPQASARHRKNIAEGLVTVTLALLPRRPSAEAAKLRLALRNWAFNRQAREGVPATEAEPPTDDATRIRWVAENSPDLLDLKDAQTLRRALDALAVKLSGRPAAAATIARKRSAFFSALEYAVELELFEANPLTRVKWTAPEHTDVVDRRVVVNPEQARALLQAVKDTTPALSAFFGCLYFAGLRPSEAAHLHESDCTLPDEGWGQLLLTGSTQQAGSAWTDTGEVREDRSLKHRAVRETRLVPACPELVELLRAHLTEFRSGVESRGVVYGLNVVRVVGT